ncbi:E2F-associated phosphoprotein-like isoform X2 [Homarus americanus]|uniref:E2F-associated phosphoprotein-like isoform X2 n=1 Tax=Homarus americanus TaxID=6706 RepID=UPI001C483F7D|nr:E2F-associated phosphoprotein-like isoform X2 [Homarus americanus]
MTLLSEGVTSLPKTNVEVDFITKEEAKGILLGRSCLTLVNMDVSVFGRRVDADYDYFDLSDDDDIMCSSKYISSDEEDDKFFVIPKSRKSSKLVIKKDEEDDFEKEMASELSQTMQRLASRLKNNNPQSSTSEVGGSKGPKTEDSGKKLPEEKSEFYDDIYFDSDDSDIEAAETTSRVPKTKKEKRRILSNDELFYDPTLDEKDQEWVDEMRRSYQPKKRRTKSGVSTRGQPQALPQSDAVLNCPACLTTLCMDCQRHAIYHNQYRAMFVFNCNVDSMERLKFPSKGQKKRDFFRNKRKNKDKQSLNQEAEEDVQKSQASSAVPQMQQGNSATLQQGQKETDMELQETASSSATVAAGSDAVAEPSSSSHKKVASSVIPQMQPGNSATLQQGQKETDMELQETASLSATVAAGSDAVAEPSSSSHKKVSFANVKDDDETYHPVTCKICNTKVAVYDKDEVYHFFNVVTSY